MKRITVINPFQTTPLQCLKSFGILTHPTGAQFKKARLYLIRPQQLHSFNKNSKHQENEEIFSISGFYFTQVAKSE